jgi:glutaminyl-peptide cyclotransferase
MKQFDACCQPQQALFLENIFRMNRFVFSFTAFLLLMIGCSPDKKEEKQVQSIGYSFHSTLPHDVTSFTQGLVVHEGQLYESTGQEGASWVGVLDIATGKPVRQTRLEQKYFGEGITILNGKIYQLTWKNRTGFIYKLSNLEKLGTFTYQTEGWGITTDGQQLIMSDGTNKLYFLDTVDFSVKRTLEVKEGNRQVNNLNELEWINGSIYANIWQTTRIAKIDPATGFVDGYMDLSLIADQALSRNPSADVLNGIAWHSGTKSMLVTGKYWPNIFVLRLSATDSL